MFLRYHCFSASLICLGVISLSGAMSDNGESPARIGKLNDELSRFGASLVILPRNNGETLTRLIWAPTDLNMPDIEQNGEYFPPLGQLRIDEIEFLSAELPDFLVKELRKVRCHVKRIIVRASDANDEDVGKLSLFHSDAYGELVVEGKQFSPRCVNNTKPSLRVVVLIHSDRQQARDFISYFDRSTRHISLVVLARPREEKKPMSEAGRGAATEQTSKD